MTKSHSTFTIISYQLYSGPKGLTYKFNQCIALRVFPNLVKATFLKKIISVGVSKNHKAEKF